MGDRAAIFIDESNLSYLIRKRRAIVDKETRIRVGTSIGYHPEVDKRRGCTISNNGIVAPKKWL